MVGTFGVQNNVEGNVVRQVGAGIDFVIADRVGLVARTLGEMKG